MIRFKGTNYFVRRRRWGDLGLKKVPRLF